MILLWFYVVASLGILLIFLFGDSPKYHGTIIGKAHRVVAGLPEKVFGGCLRLFFGKKGTTYYNKCTNYICYERNPLMQITYLGLVCGGLFIFFTIVQPEIPNMGVDPIHSSVTVLAVALSYISFMVACLSDPGVIRKSNHAVHMNSYPYDNILYSKNQCGTCKFDKPARSKHCRVCNQCVSRFDHHCGWLNNDVGALNLRYFLWFLVQNSAMCVYGAYLCWCYLLHIVARDHLFEVQFIDSATNQVLMPTTGLVVRYLVATQSKVAFLGIFIGVIGLVLFAFALYHLNLVRKNTTTNETFKWDDLRYQLEDAASKLKKSGGKVPKVRTQQNSDERDVGCAPVGIAGSTPAPSTPDGIDPALIPLLQDPKAIKNITKFNIYNRGFWANFGEAIFPFCERPNVKQTKKQQ